MDNAVLKRESIRAYRSGQIDPTLLNMLRAEVSFANTHSKSLHFQLVTDDPSPFHGFARSYGMFRGVENYLAAVADVSYREHAEEAGLFAEQFVLRAVEAGLGTCFVGGTYSSAQLRLQMRPDWRVLFLVTFGWPDVKSTSLVARMTLKMAHRKKMSPDDFYAGPEPLESMKKRFPQLTEVLRAVSVAPSALNRRPVRVVSQGTDSVALHVDDYAANAVELGIAKANVMAMLPDLYIPFGNDEPIIRE